MDSPFPRHWRRFNVISLQVSHTFTTYYCVLAIFNPLLLWPKPTYRSTGQNAKEPNFLHQVLNSQFSSGGKVLQRRKESCWEGWKLSISISKRRAAHRCTAQTWALHFACYNWVITEWLKQEGKLDRSESQTFSVFSQAEQLKSPFSYFSKSGSSKLCSLANAHSITETSLPVHSPSRFLHCWSHSRTKSSYGQKRVILSWP